MSVEIERKFLVNEFIHQLLPELTSGMLICQGYLELHSKNTVRVRTMDQQAFLTIKGPRAGIRRAEFEYEIPLQEAKELFLLCEDHLVEKVRYKLPVDNLVWELDVFKGLNAGLIIAEVELVSETQTITLPDWVGEEVSEDPRYFNGYLASTPFTTWK